MSKVHRLTLKLHAHDTRESIAKRVAVAASILVRHSLISPDLSETGFSVDIVGNEIRLDFDNAIGGSSVAA